MGNTQQDKSQPKRRAITRDDITHRMILEPDVVKKQRQERVKKRNVIRNTSIS